ncbi:MAG TPA: serine hydrolase domain-containing protein, partial [Thermomicrobiales bacterium]|nr:serine hydrolase domain-containing protein [Thermomicrobiales bacterium]
MVLDNLTPIIEESMERWAVPGLTIGILEDGHISAAAYGVRDLETNEPATSDTMFGVGSISKMFTATTAVKMADEGRLDLDQPIETLAPTATIPAALRGAGVSLRHLLSHRSGLDGDGFADFGDDDQALERYLASLDHVGTLFPAGASWSYANIGTCIAGHILSCVAGLPFETLVQQEILAPLGLSRTGFGQAPMPDNVATGYDHGPGEEPKPHPAGTTWRSANPAGGMVSTVDNL